MEPLSATVTGGQSVRVRSNASTTSQIVTTAENGMALTVTGQATGTDGKTWYQISFISNSVEVTGFIRSDYVALSGELQAPVEEQPVEEQPTDEQPAEDTQTTSKDWDTQMQGDAWYLLDMAGQKQYKIEDLFNSLNQITEINAQYETNQKKISSQKAVIIILVILLVAAVAAVTLLIFKIKDMNDASYFSGVEEETARRRRVDRPQGGRPQNGRPAPQGGRPTAPQSERPAQQAGRPVARPTKPVPQSEGNQNPGWKSKNFMSDDDEFEFEFLNWDGDEDQ